MFVIEGTGSKSFMLVLATNRPEDLDAAILDRMDVSLHIGLPGIDQRLALVNLYRHIHLKGYAEQSRRGGWVSYFKSGLRCNPSDECLSEDVSMSIANQTDGFSGREIAKLFIAAQYAMLMAPDRILTLERLETTIQLKICEHQKKAKFRDLAVTIAEPDESLASSRKLSEQKHPANRKGRNN
jgi:ATPase family AAA domain-containing protein 3A/B